MTTPSTRRDVAHLLRRAAFGGRADEIDALAARGYEAAVAAVCDLDTPDAGVDAIDPPSFDTAAFLSARRGDDEARRAARRRLVEEQRALTMWWLERMVQAHQPHREKATLLWHDHFATSVEKVRVAELMFRQWATLHSRGAGRFDELAAAMVRDGAMLVWLDGRESTRAAPNENFAREFLELFTLGHGGGHGDQPYTEGDVAEAARAFTGWRLRPGTAEPTFVPRRHDGGTKTVLDVSGPLGADDVVAIATAHPACAPHVVARLWSRIARPAGPDDPVVRELAAPFAADLDVAALRRRMYLHPEFRAESTRTALVKTPVEYLVGIARVLAVALRPRHVRLVAALGQVPFRPPDVAGWPANEGWLSTSSALARLALAADLAGAADVSTLDALSPGDRPDALAHTLGVDGWGDATRRAITSAADPADALTLALVAPEYLLA